MAQPRSHFHACAVVVTLALLASTTSACSNILVPAGSSADGTTIISYTADDSSLFGDLSHWPAATHSPGDLRKIYSWDFGTYLGAIPQPPSTYNVVGNTNEYQLSISETTFGGLSVLSGTNGKAVCNEDYGCIDYGQLIWVTLQRSKDAREAITTMANLTNTYGYASEGESFSIADPNEVWILELIGKGSIELGAVWVATRVPDGSICAHANQARTRTFPRDSPDDVQYAPDVVSFAEANGLWQGDDESTFDFSDVYDPVTFEGARFCDARVWSVYLQVADAEEDVEQYLDYAQGYNLTNRLPMFVKVDPSKLLTVNATFWLMRNHYEGTWLDPSLDVGSGIDASPYRLGASLTWSYEGADYVNERFIGTQAAAWSFIANQRKEQRYSVLWFGVDDSTFSVKTPFYGATSEVPSSYSGANCTGRSACREASGLPGSITSYTLETMHWITNQVANYAYSRYATIAPAVWDAIVETESSHFDAVAAMDAKLLAMSDTEAAAAATAFSYTTATATHARWVRLFGELFVKFVDGAILQSDPQEETCGCSKATPGFTEKEKERIVNTTGTHYLVPEDVKKQVRPLARSKLEIISK